MYKAIGVLLLIGVCCLACKTNLNDKGLVNMEETIYNINVNTASGETQSLEQFKGKVLLVVNTASKCGFTPQLKELQQLHEELDNEKFSVVGFPCNQFGGQEPLAGEEAVNFCQKNYGVEFPIFEKVDVKGQNAHPLYKFLGDKSQNGQFSNTPKWNFHKYIIDKDGKAVDWYLSTTSPTGKKIKNKIQELLEE